MLRHKNTYNAMHITVINSKKRDYSILRFHSGKFLISQIWLSILK